MTTKELKLILGHFMATVLMMVLAVWSVQTAHAAIIFQDDDFDTMNSEGLLLDALNRATTEIVIQFGEAIGETIKWSITNTRFEISADLDLTNHQLTTARIENVAALPGGGTGLGAEGTGRIVMLTATDTTAPGCTTFDCDPGTYTWNGTAWEMQSNEYPSDMVNVAPGDSIQTAINSLGSGGGTIKLLVGTHDVTDSITLNKDNISLQGEGPGTIVRAQTGTWVGGTTNNDAVIQVGPADGTSPKTNVVVKDFQVQTSPNIHGIQVNGGYEVKVTDMTVESIGAKSSSRVGILFTDASASSGSRFTCAHNLVNSDSSGNRWVDGVHMDGNADIAGQMFGYGNGITDSMVYETIVEESQETAFAFSQGFAMSIFSNRARNTGFTAGAYGIFLNDITDAVINNNTIEGANNTADGIYLYDNVDNSSIINNAVRGGPTNFSTGVNIVNSTSSGNVVTGNQYANVNTLLSDSGTNTKLETLHHRATANPTSADDINDGYEVGTIWINTTTDDAWILVDHTASAAVWEQINGGGSVDWASLPNRSKEIGLSPEYSDAVFQADGTENTGSFTSGYDSVNLHNYYEWDTSRNTLQDYDIVVRAQLPLDFDSWDGSNPLTFNYKTTDTVTTDDKIDFYLLDTTNTIASLTGNTALVSATWATYSSTDDLSSGTWTPGGWITIKIRMYATNGTPVQAGEITLKYNGK